jgi:hypothetical protein
LQFPSRPLSDKKPCRASAQSGDAKCYGGRCAARRAIVLITAPTAVSIVVLMTLQIE